MCSLAVQFSILQQQSLFSLQVAIGFYTNFIVFTVSLVVVQFFRRSRLRHKSGRKLNRRGASHTQYTPSAYQVCYCVWKFLVQQNISDAVKLILAKTLCTKYSTLGRYPKLDTVRIFSLFFDTKFVDKMHLLLFIHFCAKLNNVVVC